jgi:hypothetical protein
MSKQRFEALKELWHRDIGASSSITVICNSEPYKEIIAMGFEAIPYMLEDMLLNGPDHWFVALYLISGEFPTKPEDAGKMQVMADKWIDWGRANGYLPANGEAL